MNLDVLMSRLRLVGELDAGRLSEMSVVVGGGGNVGSQVLSHLALAGVGRLVVIDRDVVGPENLSSPVLGPGDIGERKVDAIKRWIGVHAPWTDVQALHDDISVGVPEYVFAEHDAVVITTDSWHSRAYINRVAHRLPGKARVVVSGGLAGLNWDVITSVPGSGLGCLQCIHGEEILHADEEGGCGLWGASGDRKPDPAAGFSGGAVAAVMVTEVVSALAGSGPRYPGKLLSFDYASGCFAAYRITPVNDCSGHKRAHDGQGCVIVPPADYTLKDIAAIVAARIGVAASEVTLASEREMVSGLACAVCGRHDEVWRPLLAIRKEPRANCPGCGGSTMEFRTTTILPCDDRRLPDIGYPVGKALTAHVQGRQFEVLQVKEVKK